MSNEKLSNQTVKKTQTEKTPVYIYICHVILQAAATLLMLILLEKTLGKLIKQDDAEYYILFFLAFVATELLFKLANSISFKKKK